MRPFPQREKVKAAAEQYGLRISPACTAFGISETCYRYQSKRRVDNEEIANWLVRLISWRGCPGVIWCDNEPECISATLQGWANKRGIRIGYIKCGNPQQNAYVVRFNRAVRHERLAQYLFDRVCEVQDSATQWLGNHSREHLNMALSGFTPKQRFAMAAKFLSLLTV